MRTLNRLSWEGGERASARRSSGEKLELAQFRFLALPARTVFVFHVHALYDIQSQYILLEMRLEEGTNRAIYTSIYQASYLASRLFPLLAGLGFQASLSLFLYGDITVTEALVFIFTVLSGSVYEVYLPILPRISNIWSSEFTFTNFKLKTLKFQIREL